MGHSWSGAFSNNHNWYVLFFFLSFLLFILVTDISVIEKGGRICEVFSTYFVVVTLHIAHEQNQTTVFIYPEQPIFSNPSSRNFLSNYYWFELLISASGKPSSLMHGLQHVISTMFTPTPLKPVHESWSTALFMWRRLLCG